MKVNAQDVASVAAVIVAAVALYVGWDQAKIGRNQQHADVYPVLTINTQYLVDSNSAGASVRRLTLGIANQGVGPAFVESATWKVADREIQAVQDLRLTMPETLRINDQYQGQFENMLVGAGQFEVVWDVSWLMNKQNNALLQDYIQNIWSMEFEVCYCSLYERCWVSRYNAESPRPKPVETCT